MTWCFVSLHLVHVTVIITTDKIRSYIYFRGIFYFVIRSTLYFWISFKKFNCKIFVIMFTQQKHYFPRVETAKLMENLMERISSLYYLLCRFLALLLMNRILSSGFLLQVNKHKFLLMKVTP